MTSLDHIIQAACYCAGALDGATGIYRDLMRGDAHVPDPAPITASLAKANNHLAEALEELRKASHDVMQQLWPQADAGKDPVSQESGRRDTSGL